MGNGMSPSGQKSDIWHLQRVQTQWVMPDSNIFPRRVKSLALTVEALKHSLNSFNESSYNTWGSDKKACWSRILATFPKDQSLENVHQANPSPCSLATATAAKQELSSAESVATNIFIYYTTGNGPLRQPVKPPPIPNKIPKSFQQPNEIPNGPPEPCSGRAALYGTTRSDVSGPT